MPTKEFNKELPRAHIHPSQIDGLVRRMRGVWYAEFVGMQLMAHVLERAA